MIAKSKTILLIKSFEKKRPQILFLNYIFFVRFDAEVNDNHNQASTSSQGRVQVSQERNLGSKGRIQSFERRNQGHYDRDQGALSRERNAYGRDHGFFRKDRGNFNQEQFANNNGGNESSSGGYNNRRPDSAFNQPPPAFPHADQFNAQRVQQSDLRLGLNGAAQFDPSKPPPQTFAQRPQPPSRNVGATRSGSGGFGVHNSGDGAGMNKMSFSPLVPPPSLNQPFSAQRRGQATK